MLLDKNSVCPTSQKIAQLFADVDDALFANPKLELPMSDKPLALPFSNGRPRLVKKNTIKATISILWKTTMVQDVAMLPWSQQIVHEHESI